MPALAAAGPDSAAIVRLQALISASTFWHDWAGPAGAGNVLIGPVPAGEEPNPPYCVLEDESEGGMRDLSMNTKTAFGRITILIVAAVSAEYAADGRNAKIEALNYYGLFYQMLADQSGQDVSGERMYLTDIRRHIPPEFVGRDEQRDASKRYEYWQGVVSVGWGEG